ncbi:uncharacterized protein [Oscarella lobularis]|uniref:uncharacterized protein isoform X2 n=1 Tax=Oscarella lobularis TaxID=121494 RepID=UPI0033139492
MSKKTEKGKESPSTSAKAEGVKLDLTRDHGCAALQSARASMEDFFIAEPTLDNDVALFAVFDGHDGAMAAKYARDRFPRAVREANAAAKLWSKPVDAFTAIVCDVDAHFCRVAERKGFYSGTTAIVAAIARNGDRRRLILCNLGDSRAVLGSQGAVRLATTTHCPNSERRRIEAAGGWITSEFDEFGKIVYRVNGGLSMCRSIGDIEYKSKKNSYATSGDCDWFLPAGRRSCVFTADLVLSTPDVTVHDIGPSDDFLVLASDGLWDAVSESRAVKMATKMLRKQHMTAQMAATRIAETAIARGSSDNTTVIVICLN